MSRKSRIDGPEEVLPGAPGTIPPTDQQPAPANSQPPFDRTKTADMFAAYMRLAQANLGFAEPDYRAIARSCRKMAKLAYQLARRS